MGQAAVCTPLSVPDTRASAGQQVGLGLTLSRVQSFSLGHPSLGREMLFAQGSQVPKIDIEEAVTSQPRGLQGPCVFPGQSDGGNAKVTCPQGTALRPILGPRAEEIRTKPKQDTPRGRERIRLCPVSDPGCCRGLCRSSGRRLHARVAPGHVHACPFRGPSQGRAASETKDMSPGLSQTDWPSGPHTVFERDSVGLRCQGVGREENALRQGRVTYTLTFPKCQALSSPVPASWYRPSSRADTPKS